MKRGDFINKAEKIYGKYEQAYKIAVATYLATHYADDQLETMFSKVLETVIPGLGKCLTIPDIDKIRIRDTEAKAEAIWISLLPKSAVPDTFIVDYSAFRAIASYGSWSRFCEARDSNREWTHKDFVRLYKVFGGRAKEEPRLLIGSAHEVAGAFGAPVQIIGDEAEGRRLLENKKPDAIKEKLLGFIKKVEE